MNMQKVIPSKFICMHKYIFFNWQFPIEQTNNQLFEEVG